MARREFLQLADHYDPCKHDVAGWFVSEKLDGTRPVNLASGQGYRLRDLLHLMLKLDGYEGARIEYDTSQPTMIPKRLIDPSLAKKLFGFEAKVPIEEGLKRTLVWYRANPE